MSKNVKKYFTDPELIKELYALMYFSHNLLIENNIVYYADSGTLLGAMRHKGIINFDNDLDICINYKDVDCLMSLKKEFKKAGYSLFYHDEGWIKAKSKGGAQLDFFPVRCVQRNLKTGRLSSRGEYIFEYQLDVFQYKPLRFYHKLKDVFPLRQTKFGSGVVIIPNNPFPYLDKSYGKTWDKVAYITQESDTHYELDEPIKIKMDVFRPAKLFASSKNQIKLKSTDPYLNSITW